MSFSATNSCLIPFQSHSSFLKRSKPERHKGGIDRGLKAQSKGNSLNSLFFNDFDYEQCKKLLQNNPGFIYLIIFFIVLIYLLRFHIKFTVFTSCSFISFMIVNNVKNCFEITQALFIELIFLLYWFIYLFSFYIKFTVHKLFFISFENNNLQKKIVEFTFMFISSLSKCIKSK